MKSIQSHCSSRRRRRNPQGFTLIEMRVTITIIAVLAAPIFGPSAKSIASANKAVCIQNLHGIGPSIQAYAGEHNGIQPGPLCGGQAAEVPVAKAVQEDAQLKGGVLVNFIARYMEGDRDVPASGKCLLG